MKIKNPFLKRHIFSNVGQFQACSKADSIKSNGYVWMDSIEGKERSIYIRCLNCTKLFELGNKSGSRGEPLMIDRKKKVGPCLVCPYCYSHVWTALKGYEPGTVDDLFTKNVDNVRRYET